MDKKRLKEIEEIISYKFNDSSLLELAFTHSSYSNEMKSGRLSNNERLEFLGDAVLELVTSEYLFTKYALENEGKLSKMRASIVCEPTLAGFSRDMSFGDYLLLGKGEDASGGRDRDSLLSDGVEALIGAIYLDGGYPKARKFIKKKFLKNIEDKKLFVDNKTYLQELLQRSSNLAITYEVIDERGPDHQKFFVVVVKHGDEVIGRGEGKSKKAAEQDAASNAINNLPIAKKSQCI